MKKLASEIVKAANELDKLDFKEAANTMDSILKDILRDINGKQGTEKQEGRGEVR